MSNFLCVDRVAFTIGGYEIYWYGLIMCIAIIAAVLVATMYCKIHGYNVEMPLNIALVILPTGILSARLFAVLFDSSLSISDYFNFRTGGMSIIGAIIGGGLGLLIYCLVKKEKNPLRYFDTLCVVLILAQAIGRWGNYFNAEVYGKVVDASSWMATFPLAIEINGVFYQALFFYEFVLNLIGFAILSLIFLKTNKSGYTTAGYLVYYGVVRTILEIFRQEEFVLKFLGLPISQVCSALMIVVGIIVFILVKFKLNNVKDKKHEQKK